MQRIFRLCATGTGVCKAAPFKPKLILPALAATGTTPVRLFSEGRLPLAGCAAASVPFAN
jgi:hypothetical protein